METENQPVLKRLEHLGPLAYQAHYWTSFSPEKRGKTLIAEWEEQLDEDLKEIEQICQEFEAPELAPGIQKTYQEKFERYFTNWLHAKGRCISSMITGPARFPTRRAEKANNSEHNRFTEFIEWRKRILNAIKKSFKKKLDPVVEMRQKLEAAKANHELMKQGNIEIRKAVKEGRDITAYLTETFNIAPHMIDWTMKFGFGLQNNNANIKRMEERLEELERKQAKSSDEPTAYSFIGGAILLNFEMDRLQILYETKPDPETISKLKRNGFKWAPSQKAWQRQLTQNAKRSAEAVTGMQIK